MLRGISQLWVEYDSAEGASIVTQLGVELGQLGRQLKLLKNQLCQECILKEVKESVTWGKSDRVKEECR